MYDQKTFEAEVLRLWDQYTKQKPSWYNWDLADTANRDFEIAQAFLIYQHAKSANLAELLLGDVSMRGNVPLLTNFGATSATKTTIEEGTAWTGKPRKSEKVTVAAVAVNLNAMATKQVPKSEVEKHLRHGSVLNDAWWWPFKNDAWVLGGIHGLKRFHLAVAKPSDDLLWEKGATYCRVLGRELIGLVAAGYKKVSHTRLVGPKGSQKAVDSSDSMGHVFTPTDRKAAEGLTFEQYLAAMKGYSDAASIRKAAFGTSVKYEDYDFAKI